MYGNTKLLCSVPGTNIVLYQLYLNKQTNKHRKIDWTCGYQEAGDGGWGNWMKRYKLSVIQKILGMM